MATWQFWTLIGVLVLIFSAVISVEHAVKSLQAKLQELRAMLGRLPMADYRDDLERLGGQLQRVNDALRRSEETDSDLD